ncbi:MAG: hypothetical protein IPK32_01230 [Verrucomicrobiaceae bacterium]|nr:hypothetical protein [Verrucomicrobiaceae bacterium]
MKLELPSGFRKPDNDDAGPQIEQACDWIESEVLFLSSQVTRTEVGDSLEESGILNGAESRDFAEELWRRLRERIHQSGGNSPFTVKDQTISSKVNTFKDASSYAFCLLVSYAHHHKTWATKCKFKYNLQGANFEDLVCPAMGKLFPGWTVYPTGWAKGRTTGGRKIIQNIADLLCGNIGDLKRWTNRQVKEAQLDALCYRSFPDQRGNLPAFFIQCASGANLEKKLREPDMELWNKLVCLVPASLPRRAVVTPNVLPRRKFDHFANKSSGLLIDRLRIASAGPENDWLEKTTQKRLSSWLTAYVKKLPFAA